MHDIKRLKYMFSVTTEKYFFLFLVLVHCHRIIQVLCTNYKIKKVKTKFWWKRSFCFLMFIYMTRKANACVLDKQVFHFFFHFFIFQKKFLKNWDICVSISISLKIRKERFDFSNNNNNNNNNSSSNNNNINNSL